MLTIPSQVDSLKQILNIFPSMHQVEPWNFLGKKSVFDAINILFTKLLELKGYLLSAKKNPKVNNCVSEKHI